MGLGVSAWLSIHIMIIFRLILEVFFTMLRIQCGFPHPLNLSLSHCTCGQPLDLMGIHLFRCTHGGERTTCHDVVQDVFASIMRDTRFHILREQIHVLPSPILQSTCCESTLLVDGIQMSVDIIIVDPIRTNLVSQATLFHWVVVTITTQAKDGLYGDRYPTI